MKIEIEKATNGYIITIPAEYEDSIERKIVIQELEYDHNDGKKEVDQKLLYFYGCMLMLYIM